MQIIDRFQESFQVFQTRNKMFGHFLWFDTIITKVYFVGKVIRCLQKSICGAQIHNYKNGLIINKRSKNDIIKGSQL